jgi:cytidylate kinase
MNIIEKYIEDKKSLSILISGFSGSGKTVIGKSLAKDLKIEFLNLNDFYKEDYNNTIKVGNLDIVTWDSPDAIDWDKFNIKVNDKINKGIIISGFAFPVSKLLFKVDFHIHLKISKDDLIKNRADFISEREDSKLKEFKDLTPEIEKRILNASSFPTYLELIKQSKFTKTINIEYGKLKRAYDDVFDYIINNIIDLIK